MRNLPEQSFSCEVTSQLKFNENSQPNIRNIMNTSEMSLEISAARSEGGGN
jgi:hypothetical protein